MWTDEQLNAAKYTAFHNPDTKQPMNVGTCEISGTNGGIYLIVPVPPFGSLSNESNSVQGLKMLSTVQANSYTEVYVPRGMPVPDRRQNDQFIIHDYGNLVP